jgi:hypothetical protein
MPVRGNVAANEFIAWEGWDFVGALTSILTFVAALASSYKKDIHDQLKISKDRARIKAELEGQSSAFQRYKGGLGAFGRQAEAWFGPPWGWRAFDRSLQIAFIYPIALLLLAWLMGMPGTIGSYELLPNQTGGRRFLTVIFMIVFVLGYFLFIINNFPQLFANWVTDRLFGDAASEPRIVAWLRTRVFFVAYWLTVAVAVAVSVAVSVAGAVAGAGDVAVAVVVVIAVVVAVASAFVVVVAGSVGGAAAVAGAAAIAVAGAGPTGLTLVVFLIVLPFANAALDMVSWGVTRSLLAKIDHGTDGVIGVVLVIAAVLLDIAAAIACLVGLVALTAMVLEAANLLFAWRGMAQFDWKSQIDLARSDPVGQGILVTGMLATTLVPTVIHLTLGLGHAMSVWSPSAQNTADLIQDDMATSAKQKVAYVMLYRRVWMLPAFILVCLLGWGLFAAFSTWVEPFGRLLEQVALASAGLIPTP